ncbi:coagulation factor X-like isoform X4 [Hypanus sabinus]|uniref:coagulation factor X-like isoform X4 n=1 Tax=Hypanus sabinus TaxID=79690 RepID=UPI0028C4E130|nr:coagulation factor X-like isoform X4 [Hypanus sabinus]
MGTLFTMAWLLGLIFSSFVPTEAHQQVFLSSNDAHGLLSRQKRRNFLLEELRPGNLERECGEERCNFEEAREVFENQEETWKFFRTYMVDTNITANVCESDPCWNGGTCHSTPDDYSCICQTGYTGRSCEIGPQDCSSHGHTCDHFLPYPCGKLSVPLAIGDSDLILRALIGDQRCQRGEYPWQVLLKHNDEIVCGGAILNEDFVLTSAACVNHLQSFTVVLGEYNLEVDEGVEQTINVSRVHAHSRYSQMTFENDIALLELVTPIQFNNYTSPICLPETDFAEFFLMNSEYGAISGWKMKQGRVEQPVLLGVPYVPYIKHAICEGVQSFPIVYRMFCAGFEELVDPLCSLTRGSPLVTNYKGVWFLTGMSLGVDKYNCNKIPVYTKVSRYINWIKKIMSRSRSGLVTNYTSS